MRGRNVINACARRLRNNVRGSISTTRAVLGPRSRSTACSSVEWGSRLFTRSRPLRPLGLFRSHAQTQARPGARTENWRSQGASARDRLRSSAIWEEGNCRSTQFNGQAIQRGASVTRFGIYLLARVAPPPLPSATAAPNAMQQRMSASAFRKPKAVRRRFFVFFTYDPPSGARTYRKPLILLARPRGIEPLFSP